MGLLDSVFKFLKKINRPVFTLDEDNSLLMFKKSNESHFTYNLDSFNMKVRHDPYVLKAYTLNTSELHIEHIQLDHMASWRGLSRSLYESFLKEQLNIELQTLERIEVDNYEFTTYRVNDSFILHLIFIWEANKETFILDTQGKLYKTLLTDLKDNYKYNYSNEEKGAVNFDISIVKDNSLRQYFGTER